ncbi:late competence protein ComER [Cytobacillus spongiae]|jgi:competence protein ComER|uniref:late competence protein ComER n=1 Tax=Cytobacillus spongiae TaxID=2901381 RepID=UPI001F46218F|nr:late competence protein ComER [Cytobacillus spongiae]UII54946.1 late competence protein ComER [Cytobacillus spongiae]
MKIGFIGTGNMGRILIEALIDGNAVSPSSMMVMNRTKQKALKIQEVYEAVTVVDKAEDIARNAELVFICVKPHDVYPVLQTIKPYLNENKCVVSITSPISVEQIETIVDCSVARAIPSITNRALAGVSLLSFGNQCTHGWRDLLQDMFRAISTPMEIEEDITRVASDIVSCGPAFFSYLTRRFIEGAVEETEIDEEAATKLASDMLIGLGELLRKGFFTLPTLQEKVCVKGGITGEGIKVLEDGLGDVFNQLFQATHRKFDDDLELTKKQYTH